MTKASLLSFYTINTSVHLTQLISESVKASVHALKLRHDGLQGHITSRGRRSRGGRNSRSCRTSRLHTWPFRSKLSLTLSKRTGVNDTDGGVVRRYRNGDGELAKDPRDSKKKDELITGHRNLLEDRSDEVRG